MLEPEKPFSSDMIEVGVDRDVVSPIFSGMLLPLFLLIVLKPSLVLVFKTPEMSVLIHGSADESAMKFAIAVTVR